MGFNSHIKNSRHNELALNLKLSERPADNRAAYWWFLQELSWDRVVRPMPIPHTSLCRQATRLQSFLARPFLWRHIHNCPSSGKLMLQQR